MPPCPDSACDALLRNATTRARVLERQRAGDARRRRSRPASARRRRPGRPVRPPQAASDTITANSAGCTTSTRSSDAAPARRGARRAATSRRSGASGDARTRRSARRTPADASSSSRPMPAHCEPWPGNTNATLPLAAGAGPRPRRPSARRRPARPGRRAARRGPRRPPRPGGRTRPGGGQREADVGQVDIGLVRRARAAARPGRAAPSAVRADSTSGSTAGRRRADVLADSSGVRRLLEDHVRVGAADAERGHPGPARAPGRRPRRAARSAARPRPADQSTCGDGSSTCSVRGSDAVPHRHDHLDHAADAGRGLRVADVRLERAEPQRRRRPGPARRWRAAPGPRSGRRARCRCRAPPRRRHPTWTVRRLASAARMTRCCDGPFGAVSPLDAPSWLTADPRSTASTGCPLRRASDSRSTSSTPTPSAQPVPSAPRRTPCTGRPAASPRCRLNSTNVAGVAITVDAAGEREVALAVAAAPARRGAARPATTSTRCRW